MRRIFQFIISHAVFIALCAAALVFQTMQLLQLEVNVYLLLFIFFSTLCSYNFHWLLGSVAGHGRFSLSSITRQRRTLFFSLIGIVGLLFFIPLSGAGYIDLLLAFLLTFLYSIPLLPFKQLAFTRKAGFLKTVLLAFTWTFVTAYIPWHISDRVLTTEVTLIFIRRFLFMLMLCILFDNRDIASDKIQGLHSLATDLRPVTMRWLIYFIFGLLFILPFFMKQSGITFSQSLALQLSALATLITYFFSLKKQGYFFYYFLVDGLMLLSALLTTMASI